MALMICEAVLPLALLVALGLVVLAPSTESEDSISPYVLSLFVALPLVSDNGNTESRSLEFELLFVARSFLHHGFTEDMKGILTFLHLRSDYCCIGWYPGHQQYFQRNFQPSGYSAVCKYLVRPDSLSKCAAG